MRGNEELLFALGVNAIGSVDHLQTYYTVQHRHPDGTRWIDLAHYATHEDADAAMESAVAAGHATAEEVRVQHVSR
jgi:hypothetical protein